MSDALASFRELRGIGPAIEAKLHHAGVYTWAALSEVVAALGDVRGSEGNTLSDLSDQLAGRASAAGGASAAPLPNGERSEVSPVPPSSPAPAAMPSRDHAVVVDVGKVIGGARRRIEFAVSTARFKPRAEFEFRARLAARPYGQVAVVDQAWTNLAESVGRGRPPNPLPLRFEAVELPSGVQRLRLEMMLRLPSPTRRPPILELG